MAYIKLNEVELVTSSVEPNFLIEENGEVETRDIREEVLTNLVKYFVKKQKSIQVPVSHYVLDLATIQESKGKYADAKNTLELIVGENDEK